MSSGRRVRKYSVMDWGMVQRGAEILVAAALWGSLVAGGMWWQTRKDRSAEVFRPQIPERFGAWWLGLPGALMALTAGALGLAGTWQGMAGWNITACLVLGVGGLAAILALGFYKITVTSEGLAATTLLYRRLVRWKEVAVLHRRRAENKIILISGKTVWIPRLEQNGRFIKMVLQRNPSAKYR